MYQENSKGFHARLIHAFRRLPVLKCFSSDCRETNLYILYDSQARKRKEEAWYDGTTQGQTEGNSILLIFHLISITTHLWMSSSQKKKTFEIEVNINLGEIFIPRRTVVLKTRWLR